MRLPLPDPRDVVALAARGPALAEGLVSALPRALALLDAAEALVARAAVLVDEIDQTRQAADEVVARTNETVDAANVVIVRTAGTVASVEPTLERAEGLIDRFAPALEKLYPTLERLSETTDPKEVDALVSLIDQLPHLVERLDADILPIITNLKTVAPDIHDMLDVTRELNLMLAKLPGMGRIKKRVDEQQAIDGA
ncbi:hypothetical protein [Aeromicrobium alkaliterrae]|uniref:Ribulose 1,5-bisphosphate carboxylase large subunit n=1 Tax=Aeromicrobium alkaliterrae TaxID=302168 RepID=A0ABN2JR08_9ACTN